MRPLRHALLLGAILIAAPALAQTSPGVAPSGTVGSTTTGAAPEKTGATTGVGQTKPPGDVVGDNLGTRPDLEQKSKQLDEKIDKGICSGCK